jgi:Flp pilus assembly protein TadD
MLILKKPLFPLACFLALALSACNAIDLNTGFRRNLAIEAQIFDQDKDLYAQIDPLFISEEIKALLEAQVDPRDDAEAKVRTIQEILYGTEFLNLEYSSTPTYTAIETFESGQGNCLSAMNLFVAMARHVGVDAQFQTVEVRPYWDSTDDLLILSNHINATGKFSFQRSYVVDFTPEIALQQLTSREVSDLYARALYFNNLGVEAMIADDLEQAFRYFKNALFLEPEMSIAWNNIGANYKRAGNRELAEYSYHMAFLTEDRNATAVSNLARYYRDTGDEERAEEYRVAIERFNERNPYYHFARGQVAWSEKDLMGAAQAFLRALDLKQTEPDFYLALAALHEILGDEEGAAAMQQSAEDLITGNVEIFRPSAQKLRIIDSSRILRDHRPGTTINFENL